MSVTYFITRVIKTFIGACIAVRSLPLRKTFSAYDKKAENVIWIYFFGYQYPIDCMIKDLALIRIFAENNIPYTIKFGLKIGKVSNKNVFIHPSSLHDVYGFKNHCSVIAHVIGELEKQGNRVSPSYHDILFWENKEYMHDAFEKLDIRTPKTFLIKKATDLKNTSLTLPFLLKDTNSHHSKGVFKVNSFEEAENIYFEYAALKPGLVFLAQELINMKKDLRVIHIGNEIVLHYWRENASDEWRPTSTSHGSNVDFISFPEKWRQKIQANFDKLELLTGAWDITWQHDDQESEPIFLEISPLYAPNPDIDLKGKSYNYGDWKKKILLRDSFETHYYNALYDIARKKLIATGYTIN